PRVANGDNVPSVGRNLVVREVTLEGARLAALCPIEIETEIGRRFDPRHDTRDVVEVEIASGPQTVDHLLEPRRTALGIRRDDHVGRARDEPETRGKARLGYQPVHLHLQLRERRRATPFSHRHCVVTARFTPTSCPYGRVPRGASAADTVRPSQNACPRTTPPGCPRTSAVGLFRVFYFKFLG